MEWIERLNQAINYMEKHLTGEIDYDQIGQIACCSSYHFQRMFGYMAGMPLSEYIRRRKMSLAAVDLQSGEEKIIDVAARYGYDSPTAFNRAFQSVHGFAPSQAKATGQIIKSFPPICFQISIKGAMQMEYRIEKKDAFRIVGISGCPPPDMSMRTAPTWRSTSAQTRRTPNMRFGFQWSKSKRANQKGRCPRDIPSDICLLCIFRLQYLLYSSDLGQFCPIRLINSAPCFCRFCQRL